MRKQLLAVLPAVVATLALTAAPALSLADHRHRPREQSGLYVKLGSDAGFWFGRRNRHAISHYNGFRRIERQLLEKRSKLMHRTQRAFNNENFVKAQDLLTKLVRVDHKLNGHRGDHKRCNH